MMSSPATRSLLLTLAVALGGCEVVEIEREVRDRAAVMTRDLAAMRGKEPGTGYRSLRVSKRPWLGLKTLGVNEAKKLPNELRSAEGVTLPLSGVVSDAVLAARIEAATGLGVSFSGRRSAGQLSLEEAFGAALADGWTPAGGIWSGPLDRLLDAWAAAAGYEWRFEGGRITVVRSQSVVFQVHALHGEQQYVASASTLESGGGEGTSAETGQSIATTTDFEPWKEIKEHIDGLVTRETRVVVAPGHASVMVRGAPAQIDRVRSYLGYLNREVLRPVTVSVHIYSVTFNRAADYELGVSGILSDLVDGFGVGGQIEIGDGRISIVRPRRDDRATTDTLQATVRALNEAGSASRVLSADVPSLNGKPAQFFELVKEAYLREIKTTVSEGVSETNLVPGEVSSGFSMSYVARITAPDEVLVRLFASLRDRPSFAVFGAGDLQIQLPTFGSRAVQATQRLRRGETLVVSGFSEEDAIADRAGTFGSWWPFPDGYRKASTGRRERVLLITAEIGAPLGLSEAMGTEL